MRNQNNVDARGFRDSFVFDIIDEEMLRIRKKMYEEYFIKIKKTAAQKEITIVSRCWKQKSHFLGPSWSSRAYRRSN